MSFFKIILEDTWDLFKTAEIFLPTTLKFTIFTHVHVRKRQKENSKKVKILIDISFRSSFPTAATTTTPSGWGWSAISAKSSSRRFTCETKSRSENRWLTPTSSSTWSVASSRPGTSSSTTFTSTEPGGWPSSPGKPESRDSFTFLTSTRQRSHRCVFKFF